MSLRDALRRMIRPEPEPEPEPDGVADRHDVADPEEQDSSPRRIVGGDDWAEKAAAERKREREARLYVERPWLNWDDPQSVKRYFDGRWDEKTEDDE